MEAPAAQSPSGCSTLTIANKSGELVRVASWLEQAAVRFQLPERTVFKLDLVLNEALSNIISYAYPDEENHVILIKLKDGRDHVVLEIIDDGIPFNPFAQGPFQKELSLESAPIGGRGIHLINSYTDAQEYRRDNCTNTMRVNILKTLETNKYTTAITD